MFSSFFPFLRKSTSSSYKNVMSSNSIVISNRTENRLRKQPVVYKNALKVQKLNFKCIFVNERLFPLVYFQYDLKTRLSYYTSHFCKKKTLTFKKNEPNKHRVFNNILLHSKSFKLYQEIKI